MYGVPEHGGPPFNFGSLHRAWLDCRRGKGNSPSRWHFEADLERNLIRLADELQSRSYQPSPSVCFISDQPKRREIFAAAFRDRVVHHLLVRQIEPHWERRFIHDSYACRRGKGTLRAVDRTQQFIRQATANGSARAWHLHLDVRSFFVRINKAILLSILEQGIEDQGLPWAEELRWLVHRIVMRDPCVDAWRCGRGVNAVPDHKSLYYTANLSGLPIGNYSSQFFANVYLDRLDQFVKHELRQRFYLRYVDDLLLLDRDRDRLLECEERIGTFLRRELALDLNPNARVLAPTTNGIDALGYVIHRNHRLLRRRTVRRFEQCLRVAREAIVRPQNALAALHLPPREAERLLAVCMSYRGMMLHAQSVRLMRRIETEHAWLGWLWWLDPKGRVRRRFRVQASPASLAVQWRETKKLWRHARIILQIGNFWEAFGGDADWLRARLALGAGRLRPGLGAGAGFRFADKKRVKLLLPQASTPVLFWRQTGAFRGAVRERTLARVLFQCGVEPPLFNAWLIAPGAHARAAGSAFAARSGVGRIDPDAPSCRPVAQTALMRHQDR